MNKKSRSQDWKLLGLSLEFEVIPNDMNASPKHKQRGGQAVMMQQHRILPNIDAGDYDLARVTEAAWKALKVANNPPFVFRYGDSLAQVNIDTNGDPLVRRLN